MFLPAVAAAVIGATVQMVTYHVLDPAYTGVRNKNTGDFLGDVDFIMSTFDGSRTPGEQGINYTFLEQVLVEVKGSFGRYSMCNVVRKPRDCDDDSYTCEGTHNGTAGREPQSGGYWYSWPASGEGSSWNQIAVQRRIKMSCMGDAWRAAAGGCRHCPARIENSCNERCIRRLSKDRLKQVWDAVLAPSSMQCPDQPMPCGRTYVPTPAPAPAPTQYACVGGMCSVASPGASLPVCVSACVPHSPPPTPPPPTPLPAPPPTPPPTPATPAPAPPAATAYACEADGATQRCVANAGGIALPLCRAGCPPDPAPGPTPRR